MNKKISLMRKHDMSEEEILKRRMESYHRTKETPENMSLWLPLIEASTTKEHSILKTPETKIIQLDFNWWHWLRSDGYSEEKIKEFNDYLNEQLDDFLINETLFMKTGIFSNKFEFDMTTINDRSLIGRKLLDMFYTSMFLGADNTGEVVFRQMIADKENRLKIYGGMPLHTEYRVFYDFDTKKVVGAANYWHPDIMTGKLKDQDALNYGLEEPILIEDFNQYKSMVASEVELFMKGCSGLSGKWSIDVMKNEDEFWLIDMARMERSALVNQIETI